MFIENFVDMWNDLEDRFMRGDKIRVAQFQEEIANLKQGSKNVTDFFTDLRDLWEELDQYIPMPQCTCPIQCTSGPALGIGWGCVGPGSLPVGGRKYFLRKGVYIEIFGFRGVCITKLTERPKHVERLC